MANYNWFKGLAATALLLAGVSSFAAIPQGYYDGLEGKSGVALKRAVKDAAKNHTAISYGDATWEVFRESDTRYVGNQLVWWDMYSNNNVTVASGHPGLNIEHSVANSWWGGTKNDAYKDLMHLNPSNSDANSRKSNYPLGEIKTVTWDNGVTFVGKPASGDCGGASYVYEPCDEYKGDFARVFFYMFTIYDDISWKTSSGYGYMYNPSSDLLLKPWAYEMLLEWAKNDPVSQKEIDRNNAVYKHQKNRNPFIDYPELAEHIWGSKKNSAFHLDGSTDPGDDPGTDPDPDDPDQPGQPDQPGVPDGYWTAVTSSSQLNDRDFYVVVASETGVAMSYESAGKYQQVCGSKPSKEGSGASARLSKVPTDVAVLRLTKSGAGWLVNVTDLTGSSKGYLSCTTAKTLNLVSNPAGNGTTATIQPSAGSTSIQFASGSGTLQYNASSPRFLTYTSTQEPVMLYRLEAKEDAGIGTGMPETADEIIYGIYDINGRRMNADNITDLDNGIYIVVSNFGTKKILK